MFSETAVRGTDTTDLETQRTNDPEYRAKGRKALRAAIAGFFVDMYDVYLPVIALAPAIAFFMPANASKTEAATLTAMIFAVSLIGRPLGSIIFGILGDRVGRRKTTVWVAGGFTICTGLIALLPGYATAGWWAAGALIFLRLVDGIFLGGEYTAANPLAMEYAPRHRRGLYGALLNIGYPAALGFMTLLTIADSVGAACRGCRLCVQRVGLAYPLRHRFRDLRDGVRALPEIGSRI